MEREASLKQLLLKKAPGCPLWVKLMLDYLHRSYSSNQIKLLELIRDFPPGLDNVYLAILFQNQTSESDRYRQSITHVGRRYTAIETVAA
jgi:hypothetical protein